jgi:hypothetical protein
MKNAIKFLVNLNRARSVSNRRFVVPLLNLNRARSAKVPLLIIALAAVIGFSMAACGGDDDGGATDGGGGSTDIWTNITSLTQLNGTWKGPFTLTLPYGEGITEKNVREITLTYTATDSNTGTWTRSEKLTITFSGGNINTAWPAIKEEYKSMDNGVIATDMTFNDSTHTVSYTSPPDAPSPTTLSDVSGTQINQNGTKLRWPARQEEGSYRQAEIIFTKQ